MIHLKRVAGDATTFIAKILVDLTMWVLPHDVFTPVWVKVEMGEWVTVQLLPNSAQIPVILFHAFSQDEHLFRPENYENGQSLAKLG